MPPQQQDVSTGFPELVNFRKKYPQYSDLDDQTVIDRLSKKYPKAYGDLPEKYSAFSKSKTTETVKTPEIEETDQVKNNIIPATDEVKRTPKTIEPHTNVFTSLQNKQQPPKKEVDEFERFRTIKLPGGDVVLPDKSKTPQLVNVKGEFDPKATEMMKEQIASQKPKDYFKLKEFQKDLDRIEYLDQKYSTGSGITPEDIAKDERELQNLINKRNTSAGIHTGLTYGELEDAKLFRAHQKIQSLKGKTDFDKDLSNASQHIYKGVLDAINVTVGSNYEPIAKSDIRKDLTNLTINEEFKKETQPKTLFGSTVQGLTTTASLAPLFAFGFAAGGVKQGAGYLKNLLAATKGSLITFAPGGVSRGLDESINELKLREANGEEMDTLDRVWLFTKNVGGETLKNTMEGVSEMMIPGFKPGKTFLTNVLKKSTLGIATETATEQISDITGDLVDGTNTSLLVSFARDGKFSEEAIHQFLTEAIIAAIYGSTVGGGEFWFGHLENQLPPEQFEKLKGYVDQNKEKLEKNLNKTVKKVNDESGKIFDQYVRDLQSPAKIKTQPKDYFKLTEQDQGLFPPTKDFENKTINVGQEELNLGELTDLTPQEKQRNGLPQTESFDKDFELINGIANKVANGQTDFTPQEQIIQSVYPAQINDLTKQITQSPEFRQKQSLQRQQEKQLLKKETDRFAELTRQTKNSQRKKVLSDTEKLKQEIDQINSPEIKQKLVDLLNDAEKYNQKLIEGNKLTIDNLAKKKYGKTPNELDEGQQKDLLSEYNDMRKQGISEFRNIQPFKEVQDASTIRGDQRIAPQTTPGLGRIEDQTSGGENIQQQTGEQVQPRTPKLRQDEKTSKEKTENVKKYFNSHGSDYSFKSFIETEVEERGNYDQEFVDDIKKKYNLKDSDRVIWVTPDKRIAHSYNLTADERSKIDDIPEGDLIATEFTEDDGFIIPETDDGDNGFLMVLGKKGPETEASTREEMISNPPTDAQKEAGNYKKLHVKKDGLDISIENPKGSIRSGKDSDGETWETEMKNDYGYIKGTVGRDKDHLDVFLADDYQENAPVFVVNQIIDGEFDEHKVMLGFKNTTEAEEAYYSNYNKDAIKYYPQVVEMSMERFKEWSKNKTLTKNPATEKESFLEKFFKLPESKQAEIKSNYQTERGKAKEKDRAAIDKKYEELVDKELEIRKQKKQQTDLSGAPEGAFAVKLTDGKVVYDGTATNHTELIENQGVESLDVMEVGFISEGEFLTTKQVAEKAKKEIEEEKTPQTKLNYIPDDYEKASSSYYVHTRTEGMQLIEGTSVRLKFDGDFFLHKDLGDDNLWVVSEASTGMKLTEGKTKREAVDEANKKLETAGAEKIVKTFQDAISRKGVTPRYKLKAQKPTEKATENNEASIKRMVGENKTFWQIAQALNIPVDEVIGKSGVSIGKNKDGEFLFEDDKGIRYKLEGKNRNIRVSEGVGIIPGSKQVSVNRTDPEWLTKEELQKQKDDQKPLMDKIELEDRIQRIKDRAKEAESFEDFESFLTAANVRDLSEAGLVSEKNNNPNRAELKSFYESNAKKEKVTEEETEETPAMATDAKGYPIAIDEWGNEHTIKLWGTHIVKTGPDTIGGTGWEWYGFKKSGDIWDGFVHGFEDEFGSFSESELRENKVTIKTDPKDLQELMPPVGWKWKPATQKPKAIKRKNLVTGKEEEIDTENVDRVANIGKLAYDSKTFDEFFGLLNENDKSALVKSGLVRKDKSNYSMDDIVYFYNRNKNPKSPEASTKEDDYPFADDPRTEAIGVLTGRKVEQVEEGGYEFVKGKLSDDMYYELVGFVAGSKADQFRKAKGDYITIRKKKGIAKSVIDDDMKNIIKDIEKGLEGITFQLKKPLAKEGQPLTEKQFYNNYYQHKLIRKDKNDEDVVEKIKEEGFKSHIGPNALPTRSMQGDPKEMIIRSFGHRAGDTILLIPKEWIKDTPNGPKIKDGFKPKEYEVVTVTKDLESLYELYKKKFESTPDFKKDIGPKTVSKKLETPEFKKWFGESKVVDENGKPLVVYHGTGDDISVFDRDISFQGFYFAKSSIYAGEFTDYGRGNIIPAYLKMENPLDLSSYGVKKYDRDELDSILSAEGLDTIEFTVPGGEKVKIWEAIRHYNLGDEAQASGYDGIIFQEDNLDQKGRGKKSEAYLVFEPTQIKSAIANKGTFDKTNPDIRFQLKPGQKIPSDIQTKANELIGKFVDKNITKFDDVIKAVDQAFGRQTLERIFPALKAGYTAYLTNASDTELEKMDSFDYVRKYALRATTEEIKPETEDKPTEIAQGFQPKDRWEENLIKAREYAKALNIEFTGKSLEELVRDINARLEMRGEKKPGPASIGVSRPFIQRVREEIRSGNVLNKTQLEKIAKEFGITDQNVAKEQAELAIVAEARKIINETVDEKETYDKLVEMYGNQPNLTHRTNETVEKQQYSTPAPIAYMAGLFVADSVNAGDVLEPSAGNGMLTIAFNTNQVYVNEIDEVRLANLRQTGYQEITTKDSEKDDNLFNKKFDGIMTNPPFGGTQEKNFDGYKLNKLEHIMAANALNQMKDDGRAGIIIGGHNRYDNKGRLKNDRLFFNWLYNHYNVDDVINISGDLYRKQGAGFPIRLILVNGRKATPQGASPLFNEIADAEVKDFNDLYDRIERIRNGNLLRPQDNADRGPGKVTDLQDTERAGDKGAGTIKTVSPTKDSGTNTEKPTKPRPTGDVSVRPSGTRESIPGDTDAVSGTDTGKPPLPGDTKQPGKERSGTKIIEGGPGGDIQGGFDRDASPIVTREILESEKANLPYVPQSQGVSLDTVIPRNMAFDTKNQLKKLAESVGGDIDAFVAEKLGYENKDELYSHLGAEQIDAVALAIVSIEKGQGMIVGDMTGVGKGRIAASIIRYGVLNGYEPIFFTEKADLYSDLYRDLGDIGSKELLPFIVNEKTNIVDEEGKILHSTPPESKKREIYETGDLGKYDFVCCTYSQVNSEQRGKKRGFISDLSENNIIIMDESHNASGQSNVGEYFKTIIRKSKGVTYLSATFAKRPDNMPIYALKTAISEANLTEEGLINAIQKGGVALQEILSTDMVEAGQMIRRERTYEGIKVTYKPLEEKKESHTKTVDSVTEIIRDIIAFQNNHVSDIVASMDSEAAISGETVAIETGTNMAGVDSTPFASKVFNIVDQLLFSLKADSAADEAIAAFKKGQKPVIAVKNTMESFLDYLGVNEGEVMENMDFSAVLERGLLGVMRYREKDAMGNTTQGELTVNDLSEEGRKEYRRILNKINETSTGISISPIDQIIYRLNKAGYKVGEVTGRDIQLKIRDDGKSIVEKRTEKDKKKLFRDFNNWEDPGTPRGIEGYKDMALIINASGSTGRSAHSSPKFKDQRQRMMITVQIELNINTEIQKRGRINRTGQINKPEYVTLSSAIPAEQRLLMMAKKKLKSLDANVSSDQSQAGSTFEANDFLNKYGDELVVEFLKENRELNDMLLDPLKMNIMKEEEIEKFTTKENAAHKTSGRVAFLPTKLQEEFYKEMGMRYDDKIAYLNSIGENDLEVQTLPLDAVTTNSKMIIAGKGGYSPFGRDTMIETVEINVLRKPLKKEEIDELLETYLDGSTPDNKKKAIQQDFREFWKGWTAEHLQKKRDVIAKRLEISPETVLKLTNGELTIEQLINITAHLEPKHKGLIEIELEGYSKLADKMFYQGKNVENNILGRFNVGRVYRVPLIRDTTAPVYSNGIFVGWGINPKRKNPYAPSAITLKFAVGDSRRIVTPQGSERDWLNDLSSESSMLEAWQEKDIKADWDNLIPNSRREVSHIVTGNILQALGGDIKGQLISYTTKNGELKRGILVKDTRGIKDNEVRVPIKRARKYIHALAYGDFIETASGDVVISNDRSEWTLEVPATKQKGGKYYLDDNIKSVVENGRFDKVGNVMRAYFKKSNLDKLIDILQDDFGQSVRLSQDQLKKIDDSDISYQIKGGKTMQDDFGNEIPVHFNKIHEYKTKHPLLKDVKVEIVPSKIVYWTREEIKDAGYTDSFINTLPKLEKGDFGYEQGKDKYAVEITGTSTHNPKGSGAGIIISSSATSSAYAEEIIHTIQRKVEQISPEVAQQIREWEQDIRDLAEEGGFDIPQGHETFAQAMVFTHLGYASENPDVAELYEVPQSIYNEFVKILDMGEISSDVLRGGEGKSEAKLNAEALEKFRGKRSGKPSIPLIDSKLIQAQNLYDKLKKEKGPDKDVYLDWVKGMRDAYGRDFDRDARQTWRQMKGGSFQLKPAPEELINKVRSKGLEIDKNLIATHKIKGEEKEYITVSTPDRAITKMIEVSKLDEGLRLFSNKKSDLLTPREILGNNQGRFPTPLAIKEAREILGDNFLPELQKYIDAKKIQEDEGYPIEDRIGETAYIIEDFARRTVAAEKMGMKNINADLWGKASKVEQAEPVYQLRSPKKSRDQRFQGEKLESEIAREQGREPETGEGNVVDFGAGLGNVFTATADKIGDFVKNAQLEKHYNIESGNAKKIYRELLTAPQWFFDKEPQLKRIWDIIDRFFVRNVNEETAILKEDKWKNSKTWKALTDAQQKEFLSALEEYEQTQYELQRDEGTTELLSWGDYADEFALTPEVADFLFNTYKPTIEAALEMVKDVDRYKIINETETNPYLEYYFEAKAKGVKEDQLEKELEKAKDEFFEDDPNAEALYENELLKMKTKDQVKALQLVWANNPNIRSVVADVLVDKKYEKIDDKVYFPSSRLNRKYYLSAIKKTTKEEKLLEGKFDDRFFTTSDSLTELEKIKEELEAQGYEVKPPGRFEDAQETILRNAVTQGDILDLALSAGVEQDNPTLERLVKAIQAKGFSRHFIPKRFIPGYKYNKENFEESMFLYITSVPFYKNRTIGSKELSKVVTALKKSGVLKPDSPNDLYIQELKTKIENRDIALSNALRAVTSAYYLALSPAYLSQQIVQPLNTLLPYLPIAAEELGLKTTEAEKAFAESLYRSIQYWIWKILDKLNRLTGKQTKATFGLEIEFLDIIKALDRQGVGKPLRSMELAGQEVDPRKHYTHGLLSSANKALRWTAVIASAPGIAIEDFTRTIGIRAFYTMAKKAGLKGDLLQDYISSSIAKTYGPASGRLAKPPGYYIAGEGKMKPVKQLAQSTIESWLTFKNFAFMNYGQWGKIWRSLRNDNLYRTAAYKLGAQIGLGGLKYMMWSSTILSVMTLIYDMLDIPDDPEEQYEELFKHLNKLIPGMGDAFYRGVASVTFKVDLSGLFAQTAPIEEPFNKDIINMLGGAPVSAIRDIFSGRYPRFLRGYQVTDKYREEGVRLGSRKLIPPKDITESDIAKRKLGYTPLKISEAYQEENSRQFKSSQYTGIIRSQVKDVIIPLIESGNGKKARDEFRKIWEDMKADEILTDHQKKSIDGLNSFISQVVLSRLEDTERAFIKDWKNGSSRTRKEKREESRERENDR